jgi:hypothetical protein
MDASVFEPQRPLFLRANRSVGAALVEHKLVTSDALDAANARLLELLKSGEFKQASVLSLLIQKAGGPSEAAIIQYQMDTHELGAVNLSTYNLERSLSPELDLVSCWATRTLPYDRQEEFVFLATNFYLSEVVRKFWQEHFKGLQLIWSVASSSDLIEALERAEAKQKKVAT